MDNELALVLERARQNRQTTFVGASVAPVAGTSRPLVSDSTLRAGDRVFDLVLGLDGVIEGAAGASGESGATIVVQLRDGRSVTRAPEQLVRRPTPPSAI
jgi:hypothetical protein